LLWGIFITLAITTFINENEIVWLILAAGIINWLIKAPPGLFGTTYNYFISPVLLQIIATYSTNTKLIQIAWFFLRAGTFVFGSGLAIVPFLYGGVVKEYQWLNEQQFMDAVAVAMITPGPVVITVGFIGYLIAGFPGACIAAAATFLPCYVFTIIPAPYFKKYGQLKGIKSFVEGITAAAVGAIAGAVVVLARRQITDLISATIALIVILILICLKKIPEPLIILIAAATGLLIKALH